MEINKPSTKQGTRPNTYKTKTNKLPKTNNNNNNKNHPLKVVYISSPMKVTTSATGFRSLVQRLTGKGSVWPIDPSDLESSTQEFGDDQTAPNAHNGNNNAPIMNSTSGVMMKEDDSGTEFPTAELSPDTSAASDELDFQPLDHHDDVFLFDRDMPVFDEHDFAWHVQLDGVDFLDQLLV